MPFGRKGKPRYFTSYDGKPNKLQIHTSKSPVIISFSYNFSIFSSVLYFFFLLFFFLFSVKKLQRTNRLDTLKLSSFEGLEKIPQEIRAKGTKEIIKFILYSSVSHIKPLYRTKLMVVGNSNVGKTTLVDTLFSLRGQLLKKRKKK